jgi:hypothetical protein
MLTLLGTSSHIAVDISFFVEEFFLVMLEGTRAILIEKVNSFFIYLDCIIIESFLEYYVGFIFNLTNALE